MAAKILLSGRPGGGKTSVVRRTVERLSVVAGGFWTEEIRRQGTRIGFRVTDIRTGREGILAHVDYRGAPRVGKYGVDVPAFERIGVKALREAMRCDGCVVIDEIGKMELCSEAFAEVAAEVLDSDQPVLGTVPVYGHPFLNALRRRRDVRFFDVTAANRDGLPQQIAALLNAADNSANRNGRP